MSDVAVWWNEWWTDFWDCDWMANWTLNIGLALLIGVHCNKRYINV